MSSMPLPDWERLRFQRAEAEFASVRKSTTIAYALWFTTGIFGGHRFYLGDTPQSIAMLFTLGGLGLWTLVDAFFIPHRVHTINATRRATILAHHNIIEPL